MLAIKSIFYFADSVHVCSVNQLSCALLKWRNVYFIVFVFMMTQLIFFSKSNRIQKNSSLAHLFLYSHTNLEQQRSVRCRADGHAEPDSSYDRAVDFEQHISFPAKVSV